MFILCAKFQFLVLFADQNIEISHLPRITYLSLHNFIFFDIFLIFLGKSKEAEVKRINKELANIRSKFKGDKTLDGYQKKKYVCKLLFIFLLGHDIDFGHMEAVNLLSSNKYSEKQIVSAFSVIFKYFLLIIFCVINREKFVRRDSNRSQTFELIRRVKKPGFYTKSLKFL